MYQTCPPKNSSSTTRASTISKTEKCNDKIYDKTEKVNSKRGFVRTATWISQREKRKHTLKSFCNTSVIKSLLLKVKSKRKVSCNKDSAQ